MLAIAIAHGIPYAASASVGYVKDLRKKVERAKSAPGAAYLHIHVPCPTGWSYDPDMTIEVAKAAVKTGAWPLYEVERGQARITVSIAGLQPIGRYLGLQGRFSHLSEQEVEAIQAEVRSAHDRLLLNCRA
jgi:pyruvate/2-oxoacid:ferredoxin oxidoreductase beta subunit